MWDEGEEGPYQATEFADMPKKQQKAAKVLGAHPAGNGAAWPRPFQSASHRLAAAGVRRAAGCAHYIHGHCPITHPQGKRCVTHRMARCYR